MLTPQVDDLNSNAGDQRPVVAVSARMIWLLGLVIAGTVGGVSAASETLTPGEIWTAEQATAGVKVIAVPPNSTYMEIGAWGDSATLSTTPILEFWRSAGTSGTPLRPATPDVWSKLYNLLAAASVTLNGSIIDTTNSAGSARYVLDEGTYQQNLFDVRGCRMVVVRLTTAGAGGNWSLRHRFF